MFEDPWLIVLDKPPGVVTHPVAGTQSGTLANRLQAHFDTQTAVRGLLRPGIVHRLDRMTSGLLVVSKHHLAHRRLSIQFQNSQVRKSYLALVRGCVQNTEGEIALPIGQRSDSVLMTTGPQARKPRPAVTRYRVVQRFANRTLLEATPLQGRNHQIRVHCAAIGHPLLGDDFYAGDPPHCAAPGLSRHALHASRLAFTHPLLQSELRFSSALPEDLTRLLTDEPAPAST